ncbi:sporulation YhaL family protein [Bacillus sp. B-jedd]|uniref:sporulation YhaL family protein n=1 Tax=Bacillus sp. B-jedd TaxID=1476857 RepID=UPI0005156A62|nr:sporulation YhaL family protein [Bacillus sp. B-jedd]CEG29642.1 signal peptidase I [Bacillus sp. B-jedd]
MTIPFWIYTIILGIAFSAVMTVKTGKEERRIEMDLIEKEGEIYMRRLELEKEKRGLTG